MEKVNLNNKTIQLQKCCNHPYLFPEAIPVQDDNTEHLVSHCGKMIALDKILVKQEEERLI
jgi:SNF2 family DNA or RNA helicase